MCDVSVIIVNYNVSALLRKCLQSLFQYACGNTRIEVIVVDNASADDSVAMLKKEFPLVKLVASNENHGFPKANNIGFAMAKGKYIFILNPDTEFIESTIAALFTYLETHPQTGLIAPKLLNTDRSVQNSVWRFPRLRDVFFESFHVRYFTRYKNYSDKNLNEPTIAESVSGAALFFRKEILGTLCGLDESLFWIEDIDFCYRAQKAGYQLLYYPKTTVIHHVGQSAKKNYNISISNQIFNKIKFFNKYYPEEICRIVVIITLVQVVMKLIIFLLISPLNQVYYRKAKAYLYTLPKVFNPPKTIA